MEKEDNYTASLPPSFPGLDYSPHVGQTSCGNTNQMVDYMVNGHPTAAPPPQPPLVPGFCGGGSTSLDKLSFADVMQFADFGPKLGLNEAKGSDEETGLDPVYFLKFPVLNEKVQGGDEQFNDQEPGKEGGGSKEDGGAAAAAAVQLRFLDENIEKYPPAAAAEGNKGKRKRPRIKTNEEVESQRMTHIAVERNRRKQMNEHLRVLRTLMPGSYVQRGDQASIIGGAIEFVRELEQLLQCLESQKRRRLYGDAPAVRPMAAAGDSSTSSLPPIPQQEQPPFFPEFEAAAAGICEETAGSKSCLADVEVKLLGFDGMIKILSRRRPSQLIKVIAALEDLQLSILHTNITTIEQTVLYSFNVKISSETRYTAEDLANSVQQIFSFINSNSI
ncbi:PREDICTED: transcription factor FAMA [Ipomoea nil]|uniref:transcription factor FAMA n=1 Tax=Ipomoea nil TaxID=35883 RepID=UPI000901B3A6|nr:PREDICTED: transcription factor FAMA [Ipomoea nil]XP_019180981.1 PREDICTED: transcription factor FAMA [Ipomoea nil]